MQMDTYQRRNSRKQQLDINLGTLLFFIPYWLISIAAVLALFMLAAVVYMLTPLPQSVLPVVSRILVVAAELALAFVAGRVAQQPGLLTGLIFGLGFTVIFLLIGLLTASISVFSLEFLFLLFTGVLLGACGGIIGKGAAPRRKVQRNYMFK